MSLEDRILNMSSDEAEDWSYRAEGNKNVTIYNRKKGCILRIIKEARNSHNLSKSLKKQVHDEYERVIDYQRNVMSLICGSYMGEMHLTTVEEDFLAKIRETLERFRDPKRRDRRISISTVVISMSDYAFIPESLYHRIPKPNIFLHKSTYCFGLKVKYLKNLSEVNIVSPCQQYPQCATCVDRYIERVEHPGDEPISQFCPCGLISGDQETATSAIQQLITDFNTFKNRLDFCKNGDQKQLNTYGDVWDLLSEIDEFKPRIKEGNGPECLRELTEALYRALYFSSHTPVNETWNISREYISNYDSQTHPLPLPKGCILDVLVNAQQLASDIQVVERANTHLAEAIEKQPDLADKLYLYGPYDNEMWCLTKQANTPPGVSQSLMNAFLVVRNYLVYRTVADCSILISIQYLPRTCESPLLDPNSSSFIIHLEKDDIMCNVVLIDFDPKPFAKMKRYVARGKDIVDTARRLGTEVVGFMR